MSFFKQNFKLFKRMAFPLFLIVVLSSNIDQLLNQQIQASLGSSQGAEKSVYVFGFLSLLNGMLFPVFTTLFALAGLPLSTQSSPGEFIKKNLNQMMIEMMRAWGKVLQWSLLLILPGFWKYLECIFVPYVVTLSPDYQNGKEDALQASSRLFRRNWGRVLSVLFVFHLFIPLLMTSLFDAYRLLWETPLSSLALSLLDTYLILISIQILFYIFKNEGETHAHVQLERH